MGKTKTAFVSDTLGEKKSGKAAYEEKRRRQEASRKKREEEAKKKIVKGVGLKGGERVATVSGEPIIEEEPATAEAMARRRAPRIRGKKHKTACAKIDKDKTYPLIEAIKLVKKISYSKFDGTVELHIAIKPTGKKKASFSKSVTLPHSAGKKKKVEIADEKTIEKLKAASGPGGKIDFDVLLATAEMMPKLVAFAKILGPRGLMPNPKTGTLIKNAKEAKKFGGNTITVKAERKQPIIHTSFGKVSQKESELVENAEAILAAIGKKQIVKAFMKATMSPSVKLKVV
jgi:large subunit ribosomal protein L1